MAKKFCTRALSVGLSLALCASLVSPALAVTYDISLGDVTVTESGSTGWLAGATEATTHTDKNITVTGTSVYQAAEKDEDGNVTKEAVAGHTITVTGAAAGTIITLKDLTIDVSGTGSDPKLGQAAFSINGVSSDITVELDGENTLKSGWGRAGLDLSDNASVTIQDKNKDGALKAEGGFRASGIGTHHSGYDGSKTAHKITVDGATVTATGGSFGAGIGGVVGEITIKGGSNITATGASWRYTGNGGAGIGSGWFGTAGNITVDGSTVIATGIAGAGIGAGSEGTAGDITIYNSNVTATGTTGVGTSSGDGDGDNAWYLSTVGNITIDNSRVIATSGGKGAGIGSAPYGEAKDIVIKGGSDVTATSDYGAGIGSGTWSYGSPTFTTVGDITIEGSKVTARSDGVGAGIGSGGGSTAGNIVIKNGSTVKATGSVQSAGIGGGQEGTVGNITIEDSTVVARGGEGGNGVGFGAGTGIGASGKGTVGDITVSNSTVTTIAGSSFQAGHPDDCNKGTAGIGGGSDEGMSGKITIDNNVILLALGCIYRYRETTWAVDPNCDDNTVIGNLLMGEFDRSAEAAVSANTVFTVLDQDGNEIREFDMNWEGKTYYSFAINLPDSEKDYIIVQKDADGKIVNYVVYDEDNKAVYRTEQDGDSVTPMRQDGLVLKKPDTKYKFESEDGKTLPQQITNLENNTHQAGSVKIGDKVDVPGEGVKWVLQSWSDATPELVDGKLQDITLTGTWGWDGYDYEVTVKPNNGGEDIVLNGEVGGDKNPTKPTGFIKDGYNLDSWTVRDEDGNVVDVDPFAEDFIPTSDGQKLTVEANWDGYDYTVTVDPNGGQLPEGAETTLTGKVGETAPTEPGEPTNPGYGFDGWVGVVVDEDGKPVLDGDGNPIVVNPFDPDFVPTEDGQKIKVTAGWDGYDYTVTVDPDNGDEPTTTEGKVGGDNNPTTPEDPSKKGYDFTEWVAVDEDGNPIVDDDGNPINPFDPDFVPSKDGEEIKVKAKWDGYDYTVTIDPDNGEDPTITEGKVGETPVEEPTEPSKDGYEFKGWVDEDGNPIDPFGPDFVPDKDGEEIKVKAKWDGYDYTVTIDPDNGEDPTTTEGKVGETPVEEPTEPSKDGYEFKGWVDEDGNPIDPFGPDFVPDNDGQEIKVTAKWEGKEYTVEFDPNEGTLPEGTETSITATVGEGETPSSLGTDPERKGYDFTGWAPKDGNVTPEEASEGRGSIVMEAQWDGKNYDIVVDPNGGDLPEGSDPTIPGKVGEEKPELPEPTRPGHDFDGWVVVDKDGKPVTDDEGKPVKFDPDKFDPDGEDVHLEASWKKRPANSSDPGERIEDVAVPLAGLFTRADAIGYLWQQSGEPEWELSDFPDVPEDHQWAVAIGWAQDMGIALPDEEGNFRPDDLVLRSVESLEIDPEGELQEFLNRYAVYAGIVLEPDELFIELGGEWDDVIMGEDAQVIFDDFFAKLEAALAEQAA